MITKWMVSNFKSIREKTELKFSPLTIFAGANSSGKSTFIQSMLLVAQTLAHKDISQPVVLNGTLVSLGEFSDLKSNGKQSNRITIEFTCHPPSTRGEIQRFMFRSRNQIQDIGCGLTFGLESSKSTHDTSQIHPRLFSTKLFCRYKDEFNADHRARIRIRYLVKKKLRKKENRDADNINKQQDETLSYPFTLDEVTMKEWVESYHSKHMRRGCKLRHFLPNMLFYDVDPIKVDANEITYALQFDIYKRRHLGKRKSEIPLSAEVIAVLRGVFDASKEIDQTFKNQCKENLFIKTGSKTLRLQDLRFRLRSLPPEDKRKIRQVMQNRGDLLSRIYKAMKASTVDVSESNREYIPDVLPPLIEKSADYLEAFFVTRLKYLGPLRDAPKSLFPLTPIADLDDLGPRGENTASVLELYKNKLIKYIPSSNFTAGQIDDTKVTQKLEKAVGDWLRYMEVASSVKSQDKGKLGHELKVLFSSSRKTHDLTHVGVGVSQILPILIICLLANENSTLIFEQPELHLHPKVQTLLGDFFISMAMCNKQCIVETHSEYLIDRIRFRTAAATLEKPLNELTKIYFVEKSSQDSTFREVVINEYGALQDWPEGFFDQSPQQAEEILMAAMKKRKVSQNA